MKHLLIIVSGSQAFPAYEKIASDLTQYLEENKLFTTEIFKIESTTTNPWEVLQIPELPVTEKIIQSDGVIIVVPEIYHTYPQYFKKFITTTGGYWNKKNIGLVLISQNDLQDTQILLPLDLTLAHFRAWVMEETLLITNTLNLYKEETRDIYRSDLSLRIRSFADNFVTFIEMHEQRKEDEAKC